jgi:membrane-associated phospholipid phosphatase
MTIADFDAKVSDWAVRRTPIFGSHNGAANAGNHLLVAETGVAVASLLLTPSGPDAGGWFLAKTQGLAVEGAGVLVTNGAIEGLKRATRRVRPEDRGEEGVDAESFPSGHSGTAFSLATLTQRNLESMPIPETARWGLSAGTYTLAASVAWARVESGKHFPTDVLAGAAIGHFLSAFIHDAFIGLPERKGWLVQAAPLDGGAVLDLTFSF